MSSCVGGVAARAVVEVHARLEAVRRRPPCIEVLDPLGVLDLGALVRADVDGAFEDPGVGAARDLDAQVDVAARVLPAAQRDVRGGLELADQTPNLS